MLAPLENLPQGVIGFRAIGVVEPDDYTNTLDPAIELAHSGGEPIRLVIVIGDEFDRYSLGALWQDSKLGATHSPKTWGRVALVTNHEWLVHSAAIFAPLMPGEVKVFPVEQVYVASAWAAGD